MVEGMLKDTLPQPRHGDGESVIEAALLGHVMGKAEKKPTRARDASLFVAHGTAEDGAAKVKGMYVAEPHDGLELSRPEQQHLDINNLFEHDEKIGIHERDPFFGLICVYTPQILPEGDPVSIMRNYRRYSLTDC